MKSVQHKGRRSHPNATGTKVNNPSIDFAYELDPIPHIRRRGDLNDRSRNFRRGDHASRSRGYLAT
jgi:hypothetical protein